VPTSPSHGATRYQTLSPAIRTRLCEPRLSPHLCTNHPLAHGRCHPHGSSQKDLSTKGPLLEVGEISSIKLASSPGFLLPISSSAHQTHTPQLTNSTSSTSNFQVPDFPTPTAKMVSFTTLVIALTAAASSVTAFTKPCNFPYDVCGWTLANQEFGMRSLPPRRSPTPTNPSSQATATRSSRPPTAASTTALSTTLSTAAAPTASSSTALLALAAARLAVLAATTPPTPTASLKQRPSPRHEMPRRGKHQVNAPAERGMGKTLHTEGCFFLDWNFILEQLASRV
jgi:hypothetical protein